MHQCYCEKKGNKYFDVNNKNDNEINVHNNNNERNMFYDTHELLHSCDKIIKVKMLIE